MDKTKINATEREALMRINTALSLLMTEPESLKKRSKLIKRGASYLGAARGLLERYMHDVYETIPIVQLKTVMRSIQETTYTIGIRCTATMNNEAKRRKEYGVVLPLETLDALFFGCRDHCLTCGFDTEGEKRCPLRKALDEVPNDVPEEPGGGCPYKYPMITGEYKNGER